MATNPMHQFTVHRIGPEINIAGAPATLSRYSHLTFIGAETVDGVNRVISRKTSDNTLRIWRFDSTWNYVTSEALNNFDGSALGQLETAFNSCVYVYHTALLCGQSCYSVV